MRTLKLSLAALLGLAGLTLVPATIAPASASVAGSTCAARPTLGIYGDYQSYCPPGNDDYWHRVVVVCADGNHVGPWVPSNQISRASCAQPRTFYPQTWVGRPPGV